MGPADVVYEVREVPFAGGARALARAEVDGLPVLAGNRVQGIDPAGAVRWSRGAALRGARWPQDAVSVSVAEEVAAGAAARLGRGELWPARAERSWWWHGGELVPVWVVDLSTASPPATWRLLVDARDGEALKADRTSHEADGLVWPTNPVRSELVRVELPDVVDVLAGPYVQTRSCDEWVVSESLFGITTCTSGTTHAFPDEAGDFLYEPDPGSLVDPLAEVQAYFHADRMGRWLDERFGLVLPYGPIRATVNFPMANAFFGDFDGDGTPDVSFGHDPQSGVDFAYDADVVYHELGHGVVGELAPSLGSLSADEYGLEWAPGAVNEGTADALSMLLTLDPLTGEYAGRGFEQDAIRDLTRPRRCPDDLRGEVHRDGEILGSFVWQLIADPRVGPDVAAELVYGAVPLYVPDTTWPVVGEAFATTADDLRAGRAIDDDAYDAILEHLDASGMRTCGRVVPLDDGLEPDLYVVTGGFEGELERLPAGVQLSLDVPADAEAVEVVVSDFSGPDGLGWTISGRAGAPVLHEPYAVEAVGLGFSVPTEWDWRVDGEDAPGSIVLTPDGDPPLVPGETLYLSVASHNLGSLEPFDFHFAQIEVSASVVDRADGSDEAPPGGCDTGGAGLGGVGGLALIGLAGLHRRRRSGWKPS